MKNMEARRGIEVSYFNNAISLTQNGNHKGAQEKPQIKFDLEQPAEEHFAESEDGVLEIIDETEIELTLGPSSYNRGRKKVETPLTSDSGHSLSSSSTGSSHRNKITRYNTHHRTREESSGIRNSFHIEEQLRSQERLKQSPWLFQVLNLNMT
uniref:Uncharacterized protein n=2 Tax=Lotus japonicus TaxID=34305 RepID=I3S5W2_LOTJA|nr:unknown [Lotus japonicus]